MTILDVEHHRRAHHAHFMGNALEAFRRVGEGLQALQLRRESLDAVDMLCQLGDAFVEPCLELLGGRGLVRAPLTAQDREDA
jgi:hypothetical protein